MHTHKTEGQTKAFGHKQSDLFDNVTTYLS